MTHVQGFDSFDDAMKAMREAEERANALTLPQQKAIGYGDFWCRPVPEWGMFVFGQVMQQGQAEEGEDASTRASLRDSFSRGYRFGMAYSVMEPEGELGSTHVANMWPIREEDFLEAKARDWIPSSELIERVFREAAEAKRQAGFSSSVDEPAEMRVVKED